jgi:IS5 family transposase
LVAPQCRVMTDATLIPADAALDSLVHNDPGQARLEAESLQGRTKAVDPLPTRKISNQTHRSRTDPDATLAQKRGTPQQLKYKVHQSAEAESRVILDTHVTTGARHDNQPYLEQLQRIEERYRITIHEVTADRGYGSAHIIRTLQEQGKQTFIPLWSGRVGNKYLKGSLVYQKDHDRFRCPAGKYLTPTPAITENHKRYVSLSSDCQACAQASTCPARTSGSSPQRFVLRNLDQDLFEEVQTRMRDPAFGEKLSERMWKMEGLFAEAKQNHGLSRARYRGRSKVQIPAYLSAIVQNLKRLVAALGCWLITRSLKHPQRPRPNHLACQKADLFNRPGGLLACPRKGLRLRGKRRRPRPTRVCSARPPPDIASPSEGFGSGGLEIKPRSPDWHDTPSHPKRVRAGRFECLSNDLNGLSSTNRPGVILISGI